MTLNLSKPGWSQKPSQAFAAPGESKCALDSKLPGSPKPTAVFELKHLIFISTLFASAFTATQLAAENNAHATELASDCKSEGAAVGITGDDLQEYIEECILDFEETTMHTNIKPPETKPN